MKNRSETNHRTPAGEDKPGKPDRRKRAQRAPTKGPASGDAEKQSQPKTGKPARGKPHHPGSPGKGKTAGAAGKSSMPAADRRKRPGRGKPERLKGDAPPAAPPKPQPARLHKVMAAGGLGSRRALEQEIRAGGVMLNGTVATLGQSIKVGDRLQWGEREWLVVDEQTQHRTLIYNKPEGEITSRSDPEGRPTVFDRLPYLKDARWVAIGRLDINTTGLLLLTTDGELANAMMHPSSQVDREYVCRVRGMVSDEQLTQLKEGVMLEDGPAHFNDVKRMGSPHSNQPGANEWYQVTLLEGRNREVRRLWEATEHMVSRLKRVRYGAALLPKGLKMGQWHEVTPRDHRVLREDVGLTKAAAELNLQLVVNRQQPAYKQSSRSSRAKDKRLATTAGTSNPWTAGKRGGKVTEQPRERSAGRKPGKQGSSRQGAAGRVSESRRNSKPGSPAGGGRRPGSKPRRGDR